MKTITTPAGCTILVGTNATENDHVTFVHGKANDLWFHAQGVPGAHVILKGPATPECIQMAADIALQRSKGYSRVDMTTCAMVHKNKNSPAGMVILSEWKTITASRQSS